MSLGGGGGGGGGVKFLITVSLNNWKQCKSNCKLGSCDEGSCSLQVATAVLSVTAKAKAKEKKKAAAVEEMEVVCNEHCSVKRGRG